MTICEPYNMSNAICYEDVCTHYRREPRDVGNRLEIHVANSPRELHVNSNPREPHDANVAPPTTWASPMALCLQGQST